jgi:acyl-CoA reductase-like NAD-dependent aldehyde dehydrogenase
VLCTVPDANEADVDLAVTAAKQAKAAWGKTTGKTIAILLYTAMLTLYAMHTA